MGQEECEERLRLTEIYSQAVSAFQVRMEDLRRAPHDQSDADWLAIRAARTESDAAWEALERHLSEHRCLPLYDSETASTETGSRENVLEKAAAASPDIILIADDDRRFIDVNEAACTILGMPRSEIVGRRIDEFFSKTSGETVPSAWERFVAEGAQRGVCELTRPGLRRRFEYRAKSNFAPGLHLSVLREVDESDRAI